MKRQLVAQLLPVTFPKKSARDWTVENDIKEPSIVITMNVRKHLWPLSACV